MLDIWVVQKFICLSESLLKQNFQLPKNMEYFFTSIFSQNQVGKNCQNSVWATNVNLEMRPDKKLCMKSGEVPVCKFLQKDTMLPNLECPKSVQGKLPCYLPRALLVSKEKLGDQEFCQRAW